MSHVTSIWVVLKLCFSVAYSKLDFETSQNYIAFYIVRNGINRTLLHSAQRKRYESMEKTNYNICRE